MADGVVLNAGSGGVTAATDDCGAPGHTQIIKLAISTDGAATLIPAEATNGLDVDVTRVIPGTSATHLGKAEDVAHASGDVGVLAMAVRRDAAAVGSDVDGDVSTLNVDANGRLYTNIHDGGNSITVDGTVAVSGTVTVDGSGVTQPVSHGALTELAAAINVSSQLDVNIAASGATVPVSNAGITTIAGAVAGTEMQVDVLTMPTVTVNAHAVTNAGTFATQVDGAALTALQLIDDPVATLGTTTYTETTTKGMIVGAVRRDADSTLGDTTNEVGPLQMDAAGRLKVEAFSGETLPVSLASVPSHAVTNAGTFAVQVDGSSLTALQLIDDPVFADDAEFTIGTSKVMVAGFTADEASTDSLDEGDAGAARITLDRKLITTPYPHTAGGVTIFRSLDLDESEEEVKATAGQVYAMWVTNTATTTRWIKFYNLTAANTTVGTSTPVLTIGIPGNSTDDISGNFGPGGMGIAFDTAISVAATTGVADADTGAPAANDVIVNIFYK